MSRIYSARLAGAVAVEPDGADLGTVPADSVWVLRHITVVYRGAGTAGLTGFSFTNAAAEPIWWQSGPEIDAIQSTDWAGRHVMNAGDTLTFTTGDAGPWDMLVSGYLLTAP